MYAFFLPLRATGGIICGGFGGWGWGLDLGVVRVFLGGLGIFGIGLVSQKIVIYV